MRDFDPTAGEFAASDAIRIGSRHHDPSALIGAGASILGASMQSDAAGDAAAAQTEATREANALQEKQYTQTRNDLAPWRGYGVGATNKLAQLLGLSGGAYVPTADERNAIRAALLPQFTSTAQPVPVAAPAQTPAPFVLRNSNFGQDEPAVTTNAPAATGAPVVDEAGLNAAIEKQLASMVPQTDPNAADFGSLLQNFTGKDLESEPGFVFGRDQGQQALDRRAASGGNYFSGAALKAASRFNNDYASTKYNDAFNRDASQKRQAYDFLSGASTSGQNAANMTANAGTAMAGQVGANTTGLGNALGASSIASGNAIANGLNNAVSGYQQNELLNKILGGNTRISDGGYSVGLGSAYGGSRRGM